MVVSLVAAVSVNGLESVGDAVVTTIGAVLISLVVGEPVNGFESAGDDVVSAIGTEVVGDVGSSDDDEGAMVDTIAVGIMEGPFDGTRLEELKLGCSENVLLGIKLEA